MPKIIELTVEIEVQRVSCPGVWLCQDGRVSLTVFALGTSYQTCLLPPMFPLLFKDVFYFRKRFQETCALNNICCLLKEETIYCELVQWCNECAAGECNILAQYLGALNDVLFPSNICANDGVDLLMRRSKEFPGILSPKIEIATKVRIDEVWSQPCNVTLKSTCTCASAQSEAEAARQRQVCHSPQYHRAKCNSAGNRPSLSRSRSRSCCSRSICSLSPPKEPDINVPCKCPNPGLKIKPTRRSPCRRPRKCPQYNCYNVEIQNNKWIRNDLSNDRINDDGIRNKSETDRLTLPNEERLQKLILESRFIEEDLDKPKDRPKPLRPKTSPCVCEICKRYHELFHRN